MVNKIVKINKITIQSFTFLNRYISFFIFSLFLCLFSDIYASTFVVATSRIVPYQYIEDNEYYGISIDILRAIQEITDINFNFEFLPEERLMVHARNRQVNAVLSVVKNEENEDLFYFPEKPLFSERNVIFARTELFRTIYRVEDFRDLTVGLVSDMRYGKEFDEYAFVIRDFSDTIDIAIRKFISNRIPLFIANELLGHHLLRRLGFPDYRTMPYILDEHNLYFGIVRGSSNAAFLLDTINKALHELDEKGVLQEIFERYTGEISE